MLRSRTCAAINTMITMSFPEPPLHSSSGTGNKGNGDSGNEIGMMAFHEGLLGKTGNEFESTWINDQHGLRFLEYALVKV